MKYFTLPKTKSLMQYLLYTAFFSGLLSTIALFWYGQLKMQEDKKAQEESTEKINRVQDLQTGGDTYCYWMLYNFNMEKNFARDFCFIKSGQYPLYQVSIRITTFPLPINRKDIFVKTYPEINSRAIAHLVKWPLENSNHYIIHFTARNGSWYQELILNKSEKAQCWIPATYVKDNSGKVIYQEVSEDFVQEFGEPKWSSY